MVTPPIGGKLALVCCETTAGPLSIVVHEQWARIGAQFFLEMVTTGYFNAGIGVPLMRCVKNFLCQVRKCRLVTKLSMVAIGKGKQEPHACI
jgi:hypothetical protein